MTEEEFINKWSGKSAKGYGNAVFDLSEPLKEDLKQLFAALIDNEIKKYNAKYDYEAIEALEKLKNAQG